MVKSSVTLISNWLVKKVLASFYFSILSSKVICLNQALKSILACEGPRIKRWDSMFCLTMLTGLLCWAAHRLQCRGKNPEHTHFLLHFLLFLRQSTLYGKVKFFWNLAAKAFFSHIFSEHVTGVSLKIFFKERKSSLGILCLRNYRICIFNLKPFF